MSGHDAAAAAAADHRGVDRGAGRDVDHGVDLGIDRGVDHGVDRDVDRDAVHHVVRDVVDADFRSVENAAFRLSAEVRSVKVYQQCSTHWSNQCLVRADCGACPQLPTTFRAIHYM